MILFLQCANFPEERDLLMKATECYLQSSLEAWKKTTPVAKSKLSTSIWKRAEVSGEINTGTIVIASLSVLKTACCMGF